nr:hypothetical protein [Mucilaginibacter sp.]
MCEWYRKKNWQQFAFQQDVICLHQWVFGFAEPSIFFLPVNFLWAADVNNHDLQRMVGNVVNNTVVTGPYAPAFTASQLFTARRPWFFFER